MRKFAILASLVGAITLIFVAAAPQTAEAGCRKWQGNYYSKGYCGRRFVRPGRYAYVQPRAAYYVPRYRCRTRYSCAHYPYAYYPYWRKRAWGGWY
ncbi:MAG: hypothetical protein AAF405_07105 [Pseudomonadota bacterium]